MSNHLKRLPEITYEPTPKQTKADVTPVMSDQGLVLFGMIKNKWSAATLVLHPKIQEPGNGEYLRSFGPDQLQIDPHTAIASYKVDVLAGDSIQPVRVEEYLTRITFTLF